MTMVEMCVHMDCSGCESKIKKALYKIKGVDDVDIDMVTQKVTVTGIVDQKKILKVVRKTGRRAVLWPYPYNAEYHPHHYYDQHHYTESGHHHYASPSAAVEPYSVPSSSYNYRKHGYDDSHVYGYYSRQPYSAVVQDRAGDLFSDDNPHACTIM